MFEAMQKANAFRQDRATYTHAQSWEHLRKDGGPVRPIAERPNVACLPMIGQVPYSKDASRLGMTMAPNQVALHPGGLPRLAMPYSVPLPAYPAGQFMPKFLPKFLPMAAFMMPSKYPMGKKTFRCSQCRYLTDRKNNLKRHISTMHADCGKTLECCDVIFKSKAALRDHVLLFHRSGYKCRFCARNFCRKALLKRHLAVHNGQKEYGCGNCEYATSHKSNLERHRKVHGFDGPDTDEELDSDSWHDDSMEDMSMESASTHLHGNLTSGDMDIDIEETSPRKGRKSLFSLPDRLRETHNNDIDNPDNKYEQLEMAGVSIEDINSESPSDSDSPLSRRRLFATPYKCPECGLCFSSQQLLCLHAGGCRDLKQDLVRPVTTIVRPFLDDSTSTLPILPATSQTSNLTPGLHFPASRDRRTPFNIADLLPFTFIPPPGAEQMSASTKEPSTAITHNSMERSSSPEEDKQLPLKKRVLSPQS